MRGRLVDPRDAAAAPGGVPPDWRPEKNLTLEALTMQSSNAQTRRASAYPGTPGTRHGRAGRRQG